MPQRSRPYRLLGSLAAGRAVRRLRCSVRRRSEQNLWWEACPSAAGVWRQRDDALCSPQHWGIYHYALELEDAPLIACRVEYAPGPVDLLLGGRRIITKKRELVGMYGDL